MADDGPYLVLECGGLTCGNESAHHPLTSELSGFLSLGQRLSAGRSFRGFPTETVSPLQEIPASPFRVKVDPSHDASKVKAEGPGLSKAGKEVCVPSWRLCRPVSGRARCGACRNQGPAPGQQRALAPAASVEQVLTNLSDWF